jgi:hypothetical protein
MNTQEIIKLIDRLNALPESELHISEELEGMVKNEEIDWEKTRASDGTEIYFAGNGALYFQNDSWIYSQTVN